MADTNMLQLPVAVSPLQGIEEVWLIQGGTDKRTTTASIAALASGIITGPELIPIMDGGTTIVAPGTLGFSVQSTVAAPVTINLEPSADRGNVALRIVDVSGILFTYNATLVCDGSETIQGLSSFIMDRAFQAIDLFPAQDADGNYIGYYVMS